MMTDTPESKLSALGYPVERVPKPGAIYRPVMIDRGTAYVSGAVPLDGETLTARGKVISEVAVAEAQSAAALCAANNLRMLHAELGSMRHVERVLRVTGYVNSDPDFTEQHLVINGASNLLLDVFGREAGLCARSAIGVAQLPLDSSVETEMIVRLRDDSPH